MLFLFLERKMCFLEKCVGNGDLKFGVGVVIRNFFFRERERARNSRLNGKGTVEERLIGILFFK